GPPRPVESAPESNPRPGRRSIPMTLHTRVALLAGGLLLSLSAGAAADEPPEIPVGLDAYRLWERWPYQRVGARAYLRSTYDRAGGNEGADASHFLYQQADDFN